ESKRNPIIVTPAELVKEYKANEVAADNRFKNKWLRVQGTVARVSKHVWDDSKTNIELGGGQQDFTTITCQFGPEATAQMMKLKVGDTITVLGRCRGAPFQTELVDCEFAK